MSPLLSKWDPYYNTTIMVVPISADITKGINVCISEHSVISCTTLHLLR